MCLEGGLFGEENKELDPYHKEDISLILPYPFSNGLRRKQPNQEPRQ